MGDVRIEHLQVHFDVVGDSEQEFVQLFEKYINRWSRIQCEREARLRSFENERRVRGHGRR